MILHVIDVNSLFWSTLVGGQCIPHNSALLVWKVGSLVSLTWHVLDVQMNLSQYYEDTRYHNSLPVGSFHCSNEGTSLYQACCPSSAKQRLAIKFRDVDVHYCRTCTICILLYRS